jgi:hypothetical protein
MLAHALPRKPAPLLAARGVWALEDASGPQQFNWKSFVGAATGIPTSAADLAGMVAGYAMNGGFSGGQQQTQGEGPWSSADYVNGADLQSDQAYAARQQAELSRTGGDFARMEGASYRGESIPLTDAQMRAMRAGAGPLTAQAAQAWTDIEDQPIGPAANGRQLPPSKEQVAASAAARARTAKFVSDWWKGSGQFSPTTANNQNPWSAFKDTGLAVWNTGVGLLEVVDSSALNGVQRAAYRSIGVEIPAVSEFRAAYDTPAYGLTMEVLTPFLPARKLLGAPRSLGGAAFVEGKFVHDLKPLSNLELYGQAVTRTPDEALQLLQRVGHDPEVLSQYRIVKLSDSDYVARSRRLRFDFDATYGNVPDTIPSVTFKQNIASQMADGSSKIPIYVHKEVFDSDEKIVQILSHEISETQELRYVAANPISAKQYKSEVAQNIKGNLHWHAVQEGDWWLQKFRDMFSSEKK